MCTYPCVVAQDEHLGEEDRCVPTPVWLHRTNTWVRRTDVYLPLCGED